MKKSLQIFALLFCIIIFAQAPEKFSYQAIIRNASNALVTNANVGMKLSILKTSAAGTVVYAESQTAMTNINGLVSIQIGAGNVISGTIAGINWGADSYYIKTETDPAGGTTYSIAGTSQLLSVPYAMYSKSSGSGGASFTLPYAGTSSADNVIPFKITNTSSTIKEAGFFENTSTSNNAPALSGKNNSTGSFGTGVQGSANSNSNGNISSGVRGYILGTGSAGAGVYGNATNAYGVFGSATTGTGVYGIAYETGSGGYFQSDNTGKALFTDGPLRFKSINEAAGKVLTSDASGNATWQDASSHSVGLIASLISTNITAPDLTWVLINNWANLQEDGGANYNPATGEYTITKNGVYQINAQVSFNGYSAPGKYILMRINTNGLGTEGGMMAVASNSAAGGSSVGSPTLAIAHRFVAGDTIKIEVLQNSGATQIIGSIWASNGMSIQYLHH